MRALVYFRSQYRRRLHSAILREFVRQEKAGLVNRTELAERIHKKKAQITRWLALPNNFEADTISDLLFGLNKKLVISLVDIDADLTADRPAQADACVTGTVETSAYRPPTRAKAGTNENYSGPVVVSYHDPETWPLAACQAE